MASVGKYSAGHAVRWFFPSGKQHQCRLRGLTRAEAEESGEHIETLIRAERAKRPVPYRTQRWLQHVAPENLVGALVRCGLHDDRRRLRAAVDAYVDHKCKDVGQSRLDETQRELDRLVGLIGESVEVSEIVADDIDHWADSVSELASSTQSKYAAIVKGFFRWCVREGLTAVSPAAALSTETFAAEARQEVSKDGFADVLAVVDQPSRTALLLCRLAGLRIGEALSLSWDRVLSAKSQIRVRDSKRKRDREVPLVLSLREVLAELSHGAPTVVFDPETNAPIGRSAIDKRIRVACHRAGVKLWPRLFHNLRATRETEWINEFGLVNACHWIGNSQAVAAKHYAMAQAAAFEAAIQGDSDQNTTEAA